jgi:hypothetical protein
MNTIVRLLEIVTLKIQNLNLTNTLVCEVVDFVKVDRDTFECGALLKRIMKSELNKIKKFPGLSEWKSAHQGRLCSTELI